MPITCVTPTDAPTGQIPQEACYMASDQSTVVLSPYLAPGPLRQGWVDCPANLSDEVLTDGDCEMMFDGGATDAQ